MWGHVPLAGAGPGSSGGGGLYTSDPNRDAPALIAGAMGTWHVSAPSLVGESVGPCWSGPSPISSLFGSRIAQKGDGLHPKWMGRPSSNWSLSGKPGGPSRRTSRDVPSRSFGSLTGASGPYGARLRYLHWPNTFVFYQWRYWVRYSRTWTHSRCAGPLSGPLHREGNGGTFAGASEP